MTHMLKWWPPINLYSRWLSDSIKKAYQNLRQNNIFYITMKISIKLVMEAIMQVKLKGFRQMRVWAEEPKSLRHYSAELSSVTDPPLIGGKLHTWTDKIFVCIQLESIWRKKNWWWCKQKQILFRLTNFLYTTLRSPWFSSTAWSQIVADPLL